MRAGPASCPGAPQSCARCAASVPTPRARSRRSRSASARRSSMEMSLGSSRGSSRSSMTSSLRWDSARSGGAQVNSWWHYRRPRHPGISTRDSWSSVPRSAPLGRVVPAVRFPDIASPRGTTGPRGYRSWHPASVPPSCRSSIRARCGSRRPARSCWSGAGPRACSAACGSCPRWRSPRRSALPGSRGRRSLTTIRPSPTAGCASPSSLRRRRALSR